MPKYFFVCQQCKERKHKYVASTTFVGVCDCGALMDRELPKTSGQTEVREIVDPLRNITWGKDHEAIMKDRKDTHFWEVEVPRLVQTYSVETCLEQGWLIYNDKGELVINKPPSKR
jgi:hypothetical protein